MSTVLTKHHQKERIVHSRPFLTHYYHGMHDKDADFAKTGRASSQLGAIRAAVTRLVTGQYRQAVIHDEDGIVLFRMTRKNRNINIFGVFFDFETYMRSLQNGRT